MKYHVIQWWILKPVKQAEWGVFTHWNQIPATKSNCEVLTLPQRTEYQGTSSHMGIRVCYEESKVAFYFGIQGESYICGCYGQQFAVGIAKLPLNYLWAPCWAMSPCKAATRALDHFLPCSSISLGNLQLKSKQHFPNFCLGISTIPQAGPANRP